jgi:outer membrane protein OmpA-like peptidoglycan-associated protein
LAVVGLAISVAAVAPLMAQQSLSVEDIIGKLQNHAPGKLKAPDTVTADELLRWTQNRVVVEAAEKKAGSGLAFHVEERKKLAEISKQPGYKSIDIEVYFDFDSAEITLRAAKTLVPLGKALADARLKGQTFLIAGHTDGKGGADYNQRLSERRALKIREFLASAFSLEAAKLIAIGYGKEELKLPHDPYAGENRRVQIGNLTQ